MILVYTTHKNTEEAVKIANMLVQQKLAARVNIWPMQTICSADGGVIRSELGATLIAKTMESKLPEIEDLIVKHHTHATPFVGGIEIRRFNRDFRELLNRTVA